MCVPIKCILFDFFLFELKYYWNYQFDYYQILLKLIILTYTMIIIMNSISIKENLKKKWKTVEKNLNVWCF